MTCRTAKSASTVVVTAAVGALLLFPGADAALAQDDEGQIEFNNHCRTCHTMEEGDHRLGPSLHDMVGREAGSLPEYDYSDAMRSSSVVWDEENLERFIEDPDAVVPGNNMKPYSGIADPEVRAAIVDYLATRSP
jgi:cytochrome c